MRLKEVPEEKPGKRKLKKIRKFKGKYTGRLINSRIRCYGHA
jgi:hypothetical protein